MPVNDPGVIAGAAGFSVAIVALIALWWHRRGALRSADEMREQITDQMKGDLRKQEEFCSERIAELKSDLTALGLSMQSTRELLGDGRLSRSNRAQALNLLRTGVAPDTAASTLGMARREMRLLARVSQILTSR